MKKNTTNEKCSFCGRSRSDVNQLVTGPGVNICDECIILCESLIKDKKSPSSSIEAQQKRIDQLKLPKPHKIKSILDQYVIGQEHAKKVLSVAVHNHYKRLKHKTHFAKDHKYADVEIEKSNVLLIGPTGSGKTLLAKTLARMLEVPFAITDATALTEAGYVGEDVENILLSLIQNAQGDIAHAEMGIIYIDEIDKIARKTENVSITRDVSGEGVQQALLKILEGTIARVSPHGGRKHPHQEYLSINTNNILFICGGAFVGIEDIISRRNKKQLLGFGDAEQIKSKINDYVEPEDLIKFGLIPEFVGRLPAVTVLEELTEDDLVKIMIEPKNCMVKQYQKLMAMEDINLSFDKEALRELARTAIKRRTGARGLKSIVEKIMLDIMFDAPSYAKSGSVKITAAMVRKQSAEMKPGKKKAKLKIAS